MKNNKIEKKNWLNYWVDPDSWKFRGDFDGIFRDFDDPWNCCQRNEGLQRSVLNTIISHERYDSVLDVGCGLGNYTEVIRNITKAKKAVGIDMSPIAIKKAKLNNPMCEFHVLDLLNDDININNQSFSLIIISEVLWYVLPKLKGILNGLNKILDEDGNLLIEQFFPTKQNYGLDYLDSPKKLIDNYLKETGFNVESRFDCIQNEGIVVMLKANKM